MHRNKSFKEPYPFHRYFSLNPLQDSPLFQGYLASFFSFLCFCTNSCLFQYKYHYLFYINSHHWSRELIHYMKIQKNDYGQGKRHIAFQCQSLMALWGSLSPTDVSMTQAFRYMEFQVFGCKQVQEVIESQAGKKKKVKDPFCRMAFYDLPQYIKWYLPTTQLII